MSAKVSFLETAVNSHVSCDANDAIAARSYYGPMAKVVQIHKGKEPRSDLFIAEWAEHRGLIQADFEREIGADKGLVSKWFNRSVKPGPKYLEKIAALLGFDDAGPLHRRPHDDWMAELLAKNRREAEALRDVLADRSDEELRRMIATLQAAFPRDGTNG